MLNGTKHTIPLNTPVSFEGDSTIYYVTDYQDVHMPCEPNCTSCDDEHTKEPWIIVRKETRIGMPLSKLRHIFNHSDHKGRDVTNEDLTLNRVVNGNLVFHLSRSV